MPQRKLLKIKANQWVFARGAPQEAGKESRVVFSDPSVDETRRRAESARDLLTKSAGTSVAVQRPTSTRRLSADAREEEAMNDNIRDVMTDSPCAVNVTASIMDAARAMRENDIGDIIVLDGDRLYGILTDRDIVVRGLADHKDPRTTAVGEICSRELTTVKPSDSVGSAVRLMRERALRRLPVVDERGTVVGIVSLGDLAVERDRRSALADISAAPPNV
jgi:CBS domain-containing protein